MTLMDDMFKEIADLEDEIKELFSQKDKLEKENKELLSAIRLAHDNIKLYMFSSADTILEMALKKYEDKK